ncbi:MAG TPA: hypothetical protein VGK18_09900 [Propionicimonas sp.]|jgi:hypothetical protein|uniref:hypothetical protein n=1 Tax=Propionicimonas sp. TaxID=1955623 RepID=UPI002F4209C4
MLRPWQRIVGCIAAALGALLLSGCEVHGTVDVKSGTQAEANLVFTDAEVDCLGLTKYAGLVIKGSPESDGNQTCRAQGTIDLDSLKDFGVELSQVGEYVIVDLALPQQYGFMPIQVDISLPGRVLEDGGLPLTGTTVRLGDATGVATLSPSKVVALSHPGPEWWVAALLGGLVAGIVLTAVVVLLARRRHSLRTTLHADAEPPEPDDTAPATGAPTPQQATVASGFEPDVVRDEQYEAMFAPPPPGTVVAAVRAPAPAEPSPPATVAADHRIWAPPEDRGDR